MFDPLLLKTFVTVIDEGGFTRAATYLHLTQSAISGHMRRLEEQVGKKLLKRTTRAFELTADGQHLVGYARAILALNQEAMMQFSRSSIQGKIRVGIVEDFARPKVLKILQDFAILYPNIQIEIQVNLPGIMHSAMKQGEIDLMIGSHCGGQTEGVLLWQEPLVWAWADQRKIPLPSPLPLALFPEPCPYREVVLTRLAQANISKQIVMLCSSGASSRAAASSGFAIVPMPASQLGSELIALSPDCGLPELPNVEFKLFTKATGEQAELVERLAQKIVAHSYVLRAELTTAQL